MFDTRTIRPRKTPSAERSNTKVEENLELKDIHLRGLAVYFAPAGIGKTRSLEVMRVSTNWPTFLLDEPVEPINEHWQRLATVQDLFDVDEPCMLVDSLRGVLFGGGAGATLKGGISASALLRLTELHNHLVDTERFCAATINPVYEEGELVTVVRNTIAGSIGTLYTPDLDSKRERETFFSLSDTPNPDLSHVKWQVYRTRWPGPGQLLPWINGERHGTG